MIEQKWTKTKEIITNSDGGDKRCIKCDLFGIENCDKIMSMLFKNVYHRDTREGCFDRAERPIRFNISHWVDCSSLGVKVGKTVRVKNIRGEEGKIRYIYNDKSHVVVNFSGYEEVHSVKSLEILKEK